jgi:hypothetical protein
MEAGAVAVCVGLHIAAAWNASAVDELESYQTRQLAGTPNQTQHHHHRWLLSQLTQPLAVSAGLLLSGELWCEQACHHLLRKRGPV